MRASLWIALTSVVIGAALLLWSTSPVKAAPVVMFADIQYGSSSTTTTVIFDRPVTIVGNLKSLQFVSEVVTGSDTAHLWLTFSISASHSGTTITWTNSRTFPVSAVTGERLTYTHSASHYVRDSSGAQLAGLNLTLPYGTRPAPPVSPVSPDPSNLARSAVQWEPVGGIHSVPSRIREVSSNKPRDATATLDLSAIAASVREELRERSRGFYVTTLVGSPGEQRHILRNLEHELAHGSPLLKVSIWHIYQRASTGANTVELLGEVFRPRNVSLLAAPVEICLPTPAQSPERARIAVRGRLDRDWTVLESRLTDDGLLCAQTTRVAWFVIVLEPPQDSEQAAA